MKKRILLMTAMIAVLICIFAISISAAEPSYKDGEWIYAEDGTSKLAIRDTDGNPLIWYMNGEELKYVRADQTDTTQDIYVVYKIEAGGNGFDADHTPTACLKDIDIYDNGTRIEGASINSQIVLLNVEKLEVDAFNGWLFGNYYGCCLLMRGMVFPSSLKYIGQEGLTNTKIVQYWNLENTKLEWINSYRTEPFSTTTLTQEATNYTIKFPSTLSTITSTLNSKVKTIIMNPNTTLANTCQAFRNCNSLEKLFVPASFYETGFANEAFRDITSKYLVFFAGTEEQAEALQNNTGSSHNGAFKSATRISYATYLADPSTYDNSTSTIYLIYDTNYCDAFYFSEHLGDDHDCTTENYCERCKETFAKQADTHSVVTTLSYANGFDKAGVYNCYCDRAGCTMADKEIRDGEKAPIITFKGYSNPETEAYLGINVGYSVNTVLLDEYIEVTGESVTIGLFMVNSDINVADIIDGKTLELADGAKGFSVKVVNLNYSSISIEVRGFSKTGATEGSLGNYYTLKLVSAVVVTTTKGETTSTHFVQAGVDGTELETKTFNGFDFYLITADAVYGTPEAEV